jgi:hypothetical protein
MNDAVFHDLEAHVRRAVGPVPAGRGRRQQMREELLAHLLAVYDEEFARLRDEWAAAAEAKRRLGESEGLRCELQASVPLLERTFFLLAYRKGCTMWRWLFVLGCVAVLVGLGFVFPALAQLRVQGHLIALEVGLLILGVLITLGGLASLGWGVRAFRTRSS